MRKGILLFIFLLTMGFTSLKVEAHASLTDSNPEPESQLEQSPQEIKVSFNERLEDGLYTLKVLNDKGKLVTDKNPSMSDDHRDIFLPIPKLQDGMYTVSYSVISSDGHPVNGTYVFIVGNQEETRQNKVKFNEQLVHDNNLLDPTNWIIRSLYFFTLLLVSGAVLWRHFISFRDEEKLHYENRLRSLQKYHLFMLLGMIVIQGSELLSTTGISGIRTLLLSTPIGWSWISSIILSVIGLFLLLKSKWFDVSWVMCLLLAKSLNGHAVGTSIPVFSVMLNVIHLIAAALWSVGLLYLYNVWKQRKNEWPPFIYLFSKVAFISIIALILTGSLYTFALVPKITYLLDTAWGVLLLIKLSLLLLVVISGIFIRRYLKQKADFNVAKWIRYDFALMVGIIVIVGGLTHMNPFPVNEPLNWEQSKENMDVKITTSPLNPGNISFKVSVDSKDENKIPESVIVKLHPIGKNEVSPIVVPLKKDKGNTFVFYNRGPYLPFSGEWKIELNVITTNLDEIRFEKEIESFEMRN
jgi:copper transport protein